MPDDRPDLAALLGSRICHDLIGPMGAIGNGVELLMMDKKNQSAELELVAESVAHANARLRFFRLAFGSARNGHQIALPEILSILADMTRGGRLTIDWLATGNLARGDAKAIFLAIQCLESGMPYGGGITVARDGADWCVKGEAKRLKVDPAIWAVLQGAATPGEVAPAFVHFVLLAEMADHLETAISETEIALRFRASGA